MKLEAGKEMDRRCVMNWLIEICRNPTVAFNTHSDEQQIEYAHDAIVMLKEQEAKPVKILGQMFTIKYGHCPTCGKGMDSESYPHRCGFCGQAVKWDEID